MEVETVTYRSVLVARYDPSTVRRALDPAPLHHGNILTASGHYVVIFVLAYFSLQVLLPPALCLQAMYQHHLFHAACCLASRWPAGDCDDSNSTTVDQQHFAECDGLIREFFLGVEGNSSSILRLLTFLLGFYVSQVVKRFWEQVLAVPQLDQVCLYLSGLVWSKDGNKEEEREFKRDVARLAVPPCLDHGPFLRLVQSRRQVGHHRGVQGAGAGHQEGGGPAGRPHQAPLPAPTLLRSLAGWRDTWRTPLVWAATRVNVAFQTGALIPKDHKDLVAAIARFEAGIAKVELFARWALPSQPTRIPVPVLQVQAVRFAVWMTFIVDIVGSQKHLARRAGLNWAVVLNFPFVECATYTLIFSWLRVADSLRHPFSRDCRDISLAAELDVQTWRAAATIATEDRTALVDGLVNVSYDTDNNHS